MTKIWFKWKTVQTVVTFAERVDYTATVTHVLVLNTTISLEAGRSSVIFHCEPETHYNSWQESQQAR